VECSLPSAEGRGFEALVRSSQRLKNWHLLLPWFKQSPLKAYNKAGWQFKNDWVVYHVYLWHGTSVCFDFKTWFESGPVAADLTTTVVHEI